MPDEHGFPQPNNGEDYQGFMLGMYDLIIEANDIQADPDGVRHLRKAREIFMTEFQRKFPGSGKGRAVWDLEPSGL